MLAAASAVLILFGGENLDHWTALSGQWGVRDGSMVCLSAPASIRSVYESDEFILRFQYRGTGKGQNLLAVHSKMTTGGTVLRLDPGGIVPADLKEGGNPSAPDDRWIDAVIEVLDGKLRARSSFSAGTSVLSQPAGQGISLTISPGSRGFLRFEASEPGLEIRDIRVEEPGFRNLFDGKSLAGWDIVRPGAPQSPGWSVEGGVVRCRGRGSGWLRTLETYDDFILRLEYRLPVRGNSGIYVRAPLEGRVSRIGMEVQLLDDQAFRGRFRPAQFTGSVYDGIAPEIQVPAPADQWNAIEILLDGRRIRTTLNAAQLFDTTVDNTQRDLNHDKRPLSTRRLVGFIGLQEHATPVAFRNVRLKALNR